MAMWKCIVNGQEFGPISEDQLKGWIAERRLTANDLVWTEGMAEWVPLQTVPELFGSVPSYLQVDMTGTAPPGTGGQTPNKELMAQARALLKGRWGLAIGFLVLLMLLGMGASLISSTAGGILSSAAGRPFSALGGPLASNLVRLIINGPFQLSVVIFFLALGRSGRPDLNMLFAGFKNFGTALGAYLLVTLFTLLWMLLLIVPGIIAGYRYAMTFYIIADDPTIGPLDAIRKSKAMMYGHKARLFFLGLRFMGWALLCLLTCGIGFLWLGPYMGTTLVRFYDDLAQAPQEGQETQVEALPEPAS